MAKESTYTLDTAPSNTDSMRTVKDPTGTPLTRRVKLWVGTMAGLVCEAIASGAGTSFRWKGQNAGSGNSAGGDNILEPGAKAGSGTDGRVLVRKPGGTPVDHDVAITHDGTTGKIESLGGDMEVKAFTNLVLNSNQTTSVPNGVLKARGVAVTRNAAMSGNATLVATDSGGYFFLDPNGANRDVTLWASPVAGDNVSIKHIGSANSLVVKANGGATLKTLAAGEPTVLIYDGVNWQEN